MARHGDRRCNRRSTRTRSPVGQQHDLSEHAAFTQHFVCAARLLERKPLRDEWLDLAISQKIEQRPHVPTKATWLEAHQPLDAVRHHLFIAGLEPVANDVPTELR